MLDGNVADLWCTELPVYSFNVERVDSLQNYTRHIHYCVLKKKKPRNTDLGDIFEPSKLVLAL